MFYAYTRPRYQVGVYRTIGPLAYNGNLSPIIFFTINHSRSRLFKASLAETWCLSLIVVHLLHFQ